MAKSSTLTSPPAALPLTVDTLYEIVRGSYGPLSEWQVWLASECNTRFPVDTAIVGLERALQHVATLPAASHTFAVLINTRTGQRIGFEAAWPKVRVFDPSEKAGRTVRYYLAPFDAAQVAVFCLKAAERIGRGYDVFGLWLALFALWAGHPSLLYRRRARLFCVAMIVWLCRVCDLPVLDGVHADNASPALFDDFMQAQGWPRRDTLPAA